MKPIVLFHDPIVGSRIAHAIARRETANPTVATRIRAFLAKFLSN